MRDTPRRPNIALAQLDRSGTVRSNLPVLSSSVTSLNYAAQLVEDGLGGVMSSVSLFDNSRFIRD